MAAEVGDELLRQLLVGVAAGVELREASEQERWRLLGARRGVAWEAAAVQVQRVLERGDGAGEVAPQPLPFLGRHRRRRRLAGAGRVGAGREGVVGAAVRLHENLLHHLLVRTRPPRPALQRRRHRWRPDFNCS